MRYLLILLLLSGCTNLQPVDNRDTPDMYTFNKGEVTIILHPTEQLKMKSVYKRLTGKDISGKLRGFSFPFKEPCNIYVPVPRDRWDWEALVTLGHEVTHCFFGIFHE